MRKIRLLLVAFIALFGVSSAFASQQVPKASPLATDGETIQYLYNVDAKAFIVGANDWNTRASFSPNEGHQFKVKDNGNGTFTLNDWVARDNKWSSMDCQGPDNLWVDGAGRTGDGKFTIAFNDDGTFTISNTNVAGFLSVLPSKGDTKLYMSSDAEAQSTWIAVSEDDYAEWLELISELSFSIDYQFTSVAELEGQLFAIVNETSKTAMGIGISGHGNGWDMYFGTISEALNSNACYYKLEAAQGDGLDGYYYLRTYKADGNMYTAWGNTTNMGYFNSQPANGGCCFALGLNNQNGQDGKNLAVWAIEESEGKFALKNIGTGRYLKDSAPAKYDEPTYFTLCTTTPVLDNYIKALKAAKAMATMSANGVLTVALDTYAYEKVINDEATAESVKAATEALKAATLSQYFTTFEAGKYYIVDVETGLKMAAGHDYGTKGIVNESGLDLTLTPDEETHTVTFETQVSNGGNSHFLGSNLYMDAAAYGWYLVDRGFPSVYITNGSQFINLDNNNNLVMSGTPREWMIMSAEVIKLLMTVASSEAPIDATFLIPGANFSRNDARNNAWEKWSENQEGKENLTIASGDQPNFCAESFHANFFIKQTITDAPAGIYKMTAQGFYRQDGSDNNNLPVFFANDKTATFPVKTGSENSMTDASKSFSNGLYTIDPIYFEVGDDGVMTLGAKLEDNQNLWCIWDNFRLTYYGSDASELELIGAKEDYKQALAAAEKVDLDAIMIESIKTALEDALATYPEDKVLTYDATAESINAATAALASATDAANEMIGASEDYQKALAAAQEVDQSAIEIESVKTALADALATYPEDKVLTADATVESLKAATAALATAADAAEASAIAASILPKMLAFTETTNVYTQEAFDAYYTQYYDKYVAGTLTAEEARGLQDPYAETGWRAAITVDNFLLSAWDTNPDFNSAPYYINTWSVEGNNDGTGFRVPFFEYFAEEANSLGEKTLTATMTGLEPGSYSVSAWVRVRVKNETAAADATGVTFQVNDGEEVDVTEGEAVDRFNLAQYTVNGDVTDGTLKIKFNVAADNNIHWLSFKNVMFEKVGDATKIAGISEKASQNAIFNVAGQQMNGLQKGLNIVNGEKVYVK